MTTFHKIVLEFNQLLTQHKFLETINFYDKEIISTDNLNTPIVGILSLERKMKEFVENTNIKAVEVVSLLSEDNLSVTNWYLSYEHKTLGKFNGHRFSIQRWKNNRIIQENHFYNE